MKALLVAYVPRVFIGVSLSAALVLSAAAPALAAGKKGGGSPGGGSATYQGQATVVRASVLGITTTISDTGLLASSGGAAEASLLTASVPALLSVSALHATTIGSGKASRSEASVAALSLSLTGLSVQAGVIFSRVDAVCGSASGSSSILDLKINGKAISISGRPNQTINLLVGKVIINEQLAIGNGKIVNGLHVIVPGVADVVISSAMAGITCSGTPSCGTDDFVTGGGFITTPANARGNFGVAGGIKNGQFWGHLTFVEHGSSNMKIKGTGITGYTDLGANTRRIQGTAEVNGAGGFTYTVDVTDNGEPGSNDLFFLTVSNGYSAGGTLGGGNIQLHGAGGCQ